MLYWSLIFLLLAAIAGVFGFGGIAVVTIEVAQVLFFLFLGLFVVTLVVQALKDA